MVSDGIKGTISLKINTAPYKQDITELQRHASRVADYWATQRRKIIRGIRVTVRAVRAVAAGVEAFFESVGMSLTPIQRGLINAGAAVVAWILAIEAAIAAGTVGIGSAVASLAGGIGIGITLAAAVRTELAIGESQADISRAATMISTPFDILEMVFE